MAIITRTREDFLFSFLKEVSDKVIRFGFIDKL